MDFFGSPLKTFPLEITILAAVELIEKMEEIKKNIRTWGCGASRFQVMALRRGVQKFPFSIRQSFCQKFLNYIVTMISLKRFHIVTHCYGASFSITTLFCKTNNIFYSLKNWIWDKTKWWFWKYIKKNARESFRNFHLVSIYLHLKSFAWKPDFVISQKLQTPET